MTVNYYRLLQIPQNASIEQIEQAYTSHQQKWSLFKNEQPEHLKARADKILSCLETAHRVLVSPELRLQYDRTLNADEEHTAAATPTNISPTKDMSKKTTNNIFYVIIIILLITMAAVFCYYTYRTGLTDPTQPEQTKPQPAHLAHSPQTTQPVAMSTELKEAIKRAEEQRKRQAQDPTLKGLAQRIAENSNKNRNTTINYNTKFLGAQASNQNVTFRLLVIDGISISKILLASYMNERFLLDNNEVCGNQQNDLAKGILYTFAYYNSKGELLGGYYIDEQVCQSPTSSRLIKKPDLNQLKSIEVPADTDGPASKDDN